MRVHTISSGSKLVNWVNESSSRGRWQHVFFLYNEMKKSGFQLTDYTIFSPLLKASLALSFWHGISVHASAIKQGFESFTSVGNSIVDFYVKSRNLGSAMAAFHGMHTKDSTSWNIIIHGHLDQAAYREGLQLFSRARNFGFEPNVSTLVLMVQAYHTLSSFFEGQKFHAYLVQSGLWSLASVQNSFLNMYVDVDMEFATKLFGEMYQRDVISWSVMIRGYTHNDEMEFALESFRQMVSEVEVGVDGQAMVSGLKAATTLRDIRIGKLLHGFVVSRGLNYDLFVSNSLVDLYCKCNDFDAAVRAFNEMPCRNIVSWNSLLSGFVHEGKHSDALVLLGLMASSGVAADEVTVVNMLQIYKFLADLSQSKVAHSRIIRLGFESNEQVTNCLIDAYAKCNHITYASRVFRQTKRDDTVTWSTMISGFSHCGMLDEAIALYREMQNLLVEPNEVSVLNLLEACALSAEIRKSKWAHGIAMRMGLASLVSVGTAILDMYSKCGAIEASRRAFDQIPQKNITSWSAMIAAYGRNGLPHKAIALFSELKKHGEEPNPVTTLSVLSACSHGGLVEEGLSLFKQFLGNPGCELRLEHYSCVVDMLARAGNLEIALDVINTIPDEIEPGPTAWGAFLSACRFYGNTELAAGAFREVLELEPSSSAGYLLTSCVYAAGGSWADATRMRWLVRERDIKVVGAISSVHINNSTYKFAAGDRHNPLFDICCPVTTQLHSCMKTVNVAWNHGIF